MFRNVLPIWIMFIFVFFCKIIKVNHFLDFQMTLLHLISCSQIMNLFLFNVLRSLECSVVNFFSKYIMFLTSKALLDFNINLLLFMNSICFSLKLSMLTYITINYLIFLAQLFHFYIELLVNSFHNIHILSFLFRAHFFESFAFFHRCCLLNSYMILLSEQQTLASYSPPPNPSFINTMTFLFFYFENSLSYS